MWMRSGITRLSGWLGVLVVVAAGLASVVAMRTTAGAINAGLFLSTGVVLALGRRRLTTPALSPVFLTASLFLAVGVLGEAYSASLATAGGAGISLALDATSSAMTARIFAVSSLMIALFGTALSRGPARRDASHAALGIGIAHRASAARTQGLLWILCLIPVALVLAGGDLGLYVERTQYLEGASGSTVATFGGLLAVPAVALVALLTAQSRGGYRIAGVALIVFYSCYFLSTGSRRFALVPVLVALGFYAVSRRKRALIYLASAGIFGLLLTGLPIFLRALPSHGFLPYLDALPRFIATPTGWEAVANNVLVSFPIAGATAFSEPHIPIALLGTQLSPLPGQWTDWYVHEPYLRLNPFTPYSAIGELGNYGWVTLILVSAGLGGLLGYLDGRVGRLLSSGQELVALAIVALCGLFAVNGLQYDLRSAFRLIVYAVALDVAVRVWAALRPTAGPSRTPLLRLPLADGGLPMTVRPSAMRTSGPPCADGSRSP
jgi:hypothetical protein